MNDRMDLGNAVTSAAVPGWVRAGVSEARLTPYLAASGRCVDTALRLYRWNTAISEAFYPSLKFIEVSLRNALHDRLRVAHGRADWWVAVQLTDNGRRKITEALDTCTARKGSRRTPDDVVAELSFGFWVSLLSR